LVFLLIPISWQEPGSYTNFLFFFLVVQAFFGLFYLVGTSIHVNQGEIMG